MHWETFYLATATVAGALLALGVATLQLNGPWVKQELGEAAAAGALGEFFTVLLSSLLAVLPNVHWAIAPIISGATGLCIAFGALVYTVKRYRDASARATNRGSPPSSFRTRFRYARWQSWGFVISIGIYGLLAIAGAIHNRELAAAIVLWLLFSGTAESTWIVLWNISQERKEGAQLSEPDTGRAIQES